MNIIGEKIKELRKRNGMTQESLAELLNVSYQTVSKWETGITSPDLSLIVPISRLFEISTDELLGVANGQIYREKFDKAYKCFEAKDKDEMYALAVKAVKEFPGEMKYLYWLASMEKVLATEENLRERKSTVVDREKLESAVTHFKIVIENADDINIKNKAVSEIIISLKALGRPEQAKLYAEMLPKAGMGMTYFEAMSECLSGEEKKSFMQVALLNISSSLVAWLEKMISGYIEGNVGIAEEKEILDVQEMLMTKLTNGDFHGFDFRMCILSTHRARHKIIEGDCDGAMEYIKSAYEFACRAEKAEKSDESCRSSGILINKIILTYVFSRDTLKELYLADSIFDEIKEREDFKAIFA